MDSGAVTIPRRRWQPQPRAHPRVEPVGALGLLAPGGTLLRSRPIVLAATIAARAGVLNGHALWKDTEHPNVGLDLTDRVGAEWIRTRFEPAGRGRFVNPLTWQALRARGFLLEGGTPVPLAAARRALCQPLHGARVGLLSNGSVVKVTFFVTERGHDRPSVVVRALVDATRGDWLEREVDSVAVLSRRLARHSEIAEALPDPPLLVARIGRDTVMVERCNPVTAAAGSRSDARALDWLVAFQRATRTSGQAWSEDDSREVLGWVEQALDRPGGEPARDLLPALRGRLDQLSGLEMPRCAVHGDFWRGNLAFEGNRLRVYDWEWARQEGLSLFDHAAWEFGALQSAALQSGRRDIDASAVRGAVGRLAQRLPAAGIPAAFAPVALSYVAAAFGTRIEREFGCEGATGSATTPVLATLAGLLRQPDLDDQL